MKAIRRFLRRMRGKQYTGKQYLASNTVFITCVCLAHGLSVNETESVISQLADEFNLSARLF